MPNRPEPATYDGFAATFAREAATSAYNAHYDRPTVLALLGDVAGQLVLDAGCGPSLYARELLARGASVIGIDSSADMIAYAQAHSSRGGIYLRHHDLNLPLYWLPDNSIDVCLMALVIHYLHDRAAALSELHRVLKPGGRLIVSTSHPTADWLNNGGSYFTAGHVEEQWSCGLKHRYWRQPLQDWCNQFLAAGFALAEITEHQPTHRMAAEHPEEYEKLTQQPGFIAYQLVKRPDTTGKQD